MVAVAGLGLVRLLAGIANAKPVAWLVVAFIVVTIAAVILLASAPRRTRRGDRTLAALRDDNHVLAPKERPDWALYGPAGAALGIGLFGMCAVWASDPAIAGELAVQRMSAGDGGSSWSGGATRAARRAAAAAAAGVAAAAVAAAVAADVAVAHCALARRSGDRRPAGADGVGGRDRRPCGAHVRSGASVRGTDAPGRRFAVDGVGAGWRPEIAGWVATAPGLGSARSSRSRSLPQVHLEGWWTCGSGGSR